MIRTILLASALTFGTVAAQAAPLLVGGGADAQVEYGGAPAGSLVGGGNVTLQGGGTDRSYAYAATQARPGRVAMLIGGGEDARLVYQPAPAAGGLAQQATAAFGG